MTYATTEDRRWSRRAGAALVGLGLALAGCAGSQEAATIPLERSGTALAAEGDVTAERVGGNTRVTIDVAYLAPPERVAPGATTYVVWARPAAGQRAQNLGALTLTEDRRARLDTVTPHSAFELFVTAEPSATAAQPSGETVLRAAVDARD